MLHARGGADLGRQPLRDLAARQPPTSASAIAPIRRSGLRPAPAWRSTSRTTCNGRSSSNEAARECAAISSSNHVASSCACDVQPIQRSNDR
jgi:DNA-binding transcriptional regulator YdaS (Cro superfamily)